MNRIFVASMLVCLLSVVCRVLCQSDPVTHPVCPVSANSVGMVTVLWCDQTMVRMSCVNPSWAFGTSRAMLTLDNENVMTSPVYPFPASRLGQTQVTGGGGKYDTMTSAVYPFLASRLGQTLVTARFMQCMVMTSFTNQLCAERMDYMMAMSGHM